MRRRYSTTESPHRCGEGLVMGWTLSAEGTWDRQPPFPWPEPGPTEMGTAVLDVLRPRCDEACGAGHGRRCRLPRGLIVEVEPGDRPLPGSCPERRRTDVDRSVRTEVEDDREVQPLGHHLQGVRSGLAHDPPGVWQDERILLDGFCRHLERIESVVRPD